MTESSWTNLNDLSSVTTLSIALLFVAPSTNITLRTVPSLEHVRMSPRSSLRHTPVTGPWAAIQLFYFRAEL